MTLNQHVGSILHSVERSTFCQKEYFGPKGMFPFLSKHGITELLTRIFIGSGVDLAGHPIPALLDCSVPDELVGGIQAVPGSPKLLFGG